MPLLLDQVPRSAKQLTEDNEYTLFRVFLFRRVVDQFKSEARSRGYQVSLAHMPGYSLLVLGRLQPVACGVAGEDEAVQAHLHVLHMLHVACAYATASAPARGY